LREKAKGYIGGGKKGADSCTGGGGLDLGERGAKGKKVFKFEA